MINPRRALLLTVGVLTAAVPSSASAATDTLTAQQTVTASVTRVSLSGGMDLTSPKKAISSLKVSR